MYTQTRKHTVSVTLDIECYDDLDLPNVDWWESQITDILHLEGDETVNVTIKSNDMQWLVWHFKNCLLDLYDPFFFIIILWQGKFRSFSSSRVHPLSSDFS